MTTREQLVKILYRAHGLLANKVDVIKADIEELCAKELEPIIQSERQQAVEDFSARLKGNTFPLWLKNHQVDDFIALIDQAKEEYKED